jgi:hypothetical protein
MLGLGDPRGIRLQPSVQSISTHRVDSAPFQIRLRVLLRTEVPVSGFEALTLWLMGLTSILRPPTGRISPGPSPAAWCPHTTRRLLVGVARSAGSAKTSSRRGERTTIAKSRQLEAAGEGHTGSLSSGKLNAVTRVLAAKQSKRGRRAPAGPARGPGQCPLRPQYRTKSGPRGRSALCQEPTYAAQRNDIYSITSSARASSDGGTEMPSALAVFRLIAKSNRVGRSIGRSAGLVPLRMRST